MGFQLVIAEGKEAGREFAFDQDSVLIGRTDECDVVLYEAGVSRRHCRVFREGDAYFVSDEGSSNGTRVNGEKVSRRQLADGDQLGLGPIAFTFRAVELEPLTDPGGLQEIRLDQHTRVVSAAELQRSRNKGVALVPKDVDREELGAMKRRSTMVITALVPEGPPPAHLAEARGSGPKPYHPKASAPRHSKAGLAAVPAKAAPVEQALAQLPTDVSALETLAPRPRAAADALTAAERARVQREAGGGLRGRVALYWTLAPPKKRTALLAGASALGLALVAGLTALAWPQGPLNKPREPTQLTQDPTPWSFGHGPTVTFDHPDQKTFEFSAKAPVDVVAILHFQARDISTDEVVVSVNGQELGSVPPDTLAVNERVIEMLVPRTVIKRDAPNQVVFDNVRNPPGAEPWSIWNPWVEIALLPEKDDLAMQAEANEHYRRGLQKWDQRDIGAENRWEAYRNFREAWLMLESLPPAPAPRPTCCRATA